MSNNINTWWRDNLQYRKDQGKKDADKGAYNPPWPFEHDPQNEDENEAYKDGFMARRRELGDKFEWR